MLNSRSFLIFGLSIVLCSAAITPFQASAEFVEEPGRPLDLEKLRGEFASNSSRTDSTGTCEQCRINKIISNPEFIRYLSRSIEAKTGLSDATRQDWQAIADEIDRIGKAGTSSEEARKARDLASIADVYIQLKESGLADDLDITPHSLVEINDTWTHSQKENFRATLAKVLGVAKQYKPGENPSLEAAFMTVMKAEGRDKKWNACRQA